MKRLVVLFLFFLIQFRLSAQTSKIVVVSDTNAFNATISAVEHWGGMSSLIKPGQKVGLLINSDFTEPGAYVNPDVSLAVVKMCFDAGASDVVCLQAVKPEYWMSSSHYDAHKYLIDKVINIVQNTSPAKYDSIYFRKFDSIPGAKVLQKAEVVEAVFNVDVFINVPIAKHHATTILTCAMKNMMGLCTRATNVTMHLNGPKRNDPVYLAQCITDLFSIVRPHLTIVDAEMGIVSNGPSGPGDILKSGKIVVGIDPVAIDSYCADLLSFSKSDIPTLAAGEEAGLGKIDLNVVKVLEFKQ